MVFLIFGGLFSSSLVVFLIGWLCLVVFLIGLVCLVSSLVVFGSFFFWVSLLDTFRF